MDLSFARFDRSVRRTAVTIPDIGVLLASLSARQSATPTAISHIALASPTHDADPTASPRIALFSSGVHRVSGSFSPPIATLLIPRKPT